MLSHSENGAEQDGEEDRGSCLRYTVDGFNTE